MRIAYLVHAAETLAVVGQLDESLALLAQVRALIEEGGEEFWLAEIWRLHGELRVQKLTVASASLPDVLAQPRRANSPKAGEQVAEGFFHQAIAIAQQQSAKSLELRATVSLARLCQQQGKLRDARRKVSEIYCWFTEGFDTKDVQEAKELLEELSGSDSSFPEKGDFYNLFKLTPQFSFLISLSDNVFACQSLPLIWLEFFGIISQRLWF